MKRERALELLSRSKPELQKRFGVTRLALFGSTARDTAGRKSDVDILVAFDGPATSARYWKHSKNIQAGRSRIQIISAPLMVECGSNRNE